MKIFLFIAMIYMHLIDDYVLQGILSKMKQKKWWEDNAPDELYKNDYSMALTCHAFMWSISISIPVMAYIIYVNRLDLAFLINIIIVINIIIHSMVDNLKANLHKINLIQDQAIHFAQIMIYWLIIYFVCGG